jgi:hypothetical protein
MLDRKVAESLDMACDMDLPFIDITMKATRAIENKKMTSKEETSSVESEKTSQSSGYLGNNQGYNRGYYNNHSNESWRRSPNNANTVPIGSSQNQNAFRQPPPQHQFNQGQSQP